MTANQSPKDGMLPVDELRQQLVRLVYAANKQGFQKGMLSDKELNNFINELEALFTAATNGKLTGGGDELDVNILADISNLHSFIWEDAKNPSLKSKKLDVINSVDRQVVAKIGQLVDTAKQTAVAEARKEWEKRES